MTLTEFLLTRIEEDEDAARAAAGWDPTGRERAPGRWHRDGMNSVVDEHQRLVVYGDGPAPSDAEAEHIARHDPARVLARCLVDRRIVEMHRQDHECPDVDHNSGLAGWFDADDPCPTLRALGSLYADHPDYRGGVATVSEPGHL